MTKQMWRIKHIFDGDYGCEEASSNEKRVSVTLENESGEEKYVSVEDKWLTENNLDIGSKWPVETYRETRCQLPDTLFP